MGTAIVVLQIGSVIAGLLAAILWWLSAQTFFAQTKTGDLNSVKGSGTGDKAYDLGDGVLIVEHQSRVARANGLAAIASAVAVLLQAVAMAFTLLGGTTS